MVNSERRTICGVVWIYQQNGDCIEMLKFAARIGEMTNGIINKNAIDNYKKKTIYIYIYIFLWVDMRNTLCETYDVMLLCHDKPGDARYEIRENHVLLN